ncbi:hypothetical protein NX871_22085 [Burkholderia thailandensis]|nr:hypothetical protein [Burkholderia thailandensis]MCS6472624.1 hypothetical protein [Burkholderia thailandensis]
MRGHRRRSRRRNKHWFALMCGVGVLAPQVRLPYPRCARYLI